MKLKAVTYDLRENFLAYALAYGAAHDDSWTTADDLSTFDEAAEPAFLAFADDGEVLGAASLMVRGYSENGAARFRILHVIDDDPETYAALIGACTRNLPAEVRRTFLFLPEGAGAASALESDGFTVERRAYIYHRPAAVGPVRIPSPPPGVTIRPIDPERDVAEWVRVTNAAFADQPGRFDATAETLARFLAEEGAIDDGLVMAWDGDSAIGLARVAYDDEPGAAMVEQVAVVPEWQGRGVGRALLRTVLGIAQDLGLDDTWLSTGESNERAVALYESEGFAVQSVRVGWTRRVG